MELINLIENRIYEIYEPEGIYMLKGIKNDYILSNNKSAVFWNLEIIGKLTKLYEKKIDLNKNNFEHHKNFKDLVYLSEGIAYYTANAFLYKDTINNPIEDYKYYFDNDGNKKFIYPNYQNLSSIRYSMFIETSYEKIYNYWDRIGDFIWGCCFQNDLKEDKVYFSTIIDKINDKYPEFNSLESFKWLLNFKNTNYKISNQIRKDIVHYFSIDTSFNDGHLNIFQNKEEIEKLMILRKNYYEDLKKEIINTIDGYIKTCEFIENVIEIELNRN